MGSILGIISAEHGIDPSGTYHRDLDLCQIKDPFNFIEKSISKKGKIVIIIQKSLFALLHSPNE